MVEPIGLLQINLFGSIISHHQVVSKMAFHSNADHSDPMMADGLFGVNAVASFPDGMIRVTNLNMGAPPNAENTS